MRAGKYFSFQNIKIISPLSFTAAPEDPQAILDIPRRGIKLVRWYRAYVGFIFLIPKEIIIQFGTRRFHL